MQLTSVEFFLLVCFLREIGHSTPQAILTVATLYPESPLKNFVQRFQGQLSAESLGQLEEADVWANGILLSPSQEMKAAFASFASAVFTGDNQTPQLKRHLYSLQGSVGAASALASAEGQAKVLAILREWTGPESESTPLYDEFMSFVDPVAASEERLSEASAEALMLMQEGSSPWAAFETVFSQSPVRFSFLARSFELATNQCRLGLNRDEAFAPLLSTSPKIRDWVERIFATNDIVTSTGDARAEATHWLRLQI